MQEIIIPDGSGLTVAVGVNYYSGLYELVQVKDNKTQRLKLTPLQAWKVRDAIEDMECVRGAVEQEILAEKSGQVVEPMKGGE